MMTDNNLIFNSYSDAHLDECLTLFDKNCPKFFATNERQDYDDFLQKESKVYKVAMIEGKIVAAFGLDINSNSSRARITWIMTCPLAQTKGIGSKMMTYAKKMASVHNIRVIDIAASHLSASFFAKFGAIKITEIKDGWGLHMDRVDMEWPLQ